MSQHIQAVKTAITDKDGAALTQLLSITNPQLSDFAFFTNGATFTNDLKSEFNQNRTGSKTNIANMLLWHDALAKHWQVANAVLKDQDINAAFSYQNQLLQILNRVIEQMLSENWAVKVLKGVSRELRMLAVMADEQDKKLNRIRPAVTDSGESCGEESEMRLEQATRTINRSFTICLNDRTTNTALSKKWGIYYFVNELFKIYFQLNKRGLAKSILKVISSMQVNLPSLLEYPKSDAVCHLYYWGVMLFIDQDYTKAEEKLDSALRLCYKGSEKNQELILMYLIPLKLYNKRLQATEEIWSKFPRLMVLYQDLARALKRGDLRQFDELVATRGNFFIKKFIYLLIEKIRVLCTERLIYRVYRCLDSATRIKISQFVVGFKFTGVEIDECEIEGILCNMIYGGKMKGYISREKMTLVLSNKDPFPAVAL
ncbi:hypothetical protein NADFUDRAFT_45740 [Nadsonia fulvescens var. elongata DSM 6958]|uniref:PCI domain-containing protein n=1 Tax=Nadsonia fulvescens var. elongata DSM 6958 TaxID=857566 RepID=A0A1E3PL85_9ASCO|nr:hypothetical protein NADFUDRAFT_45740 [Nadsonia fulvescens var. elongata DSM 6958]